jgi:peptidyl-prolyl cis-trans isomerase D
VLLKATKITPEHQSTLEEIKPQLSERLKLDRAREEIQSIYDAVEDARAAQTKFEEIASKASIPFQLIAAVDASGKDKDGKDIELPHKTDLLKAAFGSDVGLENDAISLDEGYVWYEVREVIPSAVKAFDAVKSQAATQVLANKVRALTEEKARKLSERAGAGARLEELAAETSATVQTVQGLKRNESDTIFDTAAVSALFAVPENGFAFALESDGKSAKVIQSQAVLLPSFDPASAEATTIAEQLKGGIANDMLFAYLGALQKDAGVTINDTLWRQITGTQTQ